MKLLSPHHLHLPVSEQARETDNSPFVQKTVSQMGGSLDHCTVFELVIVVYICIWFELLLPADCHDSYTWWLSDTEEKNCAMCRVHTSSKWQVYMGLMNTLFLLELQTFIIKGKSIAQKLCNRNLQAWQSQQPAKVTCMRLHARENNVVASSFPLFNYHEGRSIYFVILFLLNECHTRIFMQNTYNMYTQLKELHFSRSQ